LLLLLCIMLLVPAAAPGLADGSFRSISTGEDTRRVEIYWQVHESILVLINCHGYAGWLSEGRYSDYYLTVFAQQPYHTLTPRHTRLLHPSIAVPWLADDSTVTFDTVASSDPSLNVTQCSARLFNVWCLLGCFALCLDFAIMSSVKPSEWR